MKILHVTAGIQETCGVSCFVVEIARAQQELGDTVAIVTSMTCGYPAADLNIILLEDPTKVDFAPDIVHIHSVWNMYVHKMAVWCRKQGIPYVISPHGALTPWAIKYKWWKKIPALIMYQYRDLREAKAFHVTVEDEANDIKRFKFRQPVVIAPLGVKAYSTIKIEKRTNDFLFLSRIHPKKGLIYLLDAWSTISPNLRQNWRIIMAGPDDIGHKEELKEHAKRLNLSVTDFSGELQYGKKQIHGGEEVPVEVYKEKLESYNTDIVFTGAVYSETKEYLYKSAKYFILPSFSENFGVVVLEALAAGTPVITTTGTPWKVLQESDCGWWIEPDKNSLALTLKESMLLNHHDYNLMSKKAETFVKTNFSWNISAKKLKEQYLN